MPSSAAARPAACALHPEQSAAGVCSRCGGFVCEGCRDFGAFETCPACRERTGEGAAFPLSRDAWTLGGLLTLCWNAFTANAVPLCVSMLVFMGISWAVSAVAQQIQLAAVGGLGMGGGIALAVPVWFAQVMLQGTLTLGLVRMIHGALGGRKVEVAQLFGQFDKIGKVLLLTLLSMLIGLATALPIVGVGFLGWELAEHAGAAVAVVLLLLPALWLLMPTYFAQIELGLSGCSATEAISHTFSVARGQRLVMFGVLMLCSFIAFAGVFALCVGLIPSAALALVVAVGFYLTLRNGSGLPPLAPRQPGQPPGAGA